MCYIRITSKCNMSCDHCGFNCTTEGEDMTLETFKAALDFGEHITLGGGEPTIHPKFWEMFGLCLGTAELTYIVTNGSMTEISLKLLEISKKSEDMFGISLSQDSFHDPIDDIVIKAYKKNNRIRNVTSDGKSPIFIGRAKEFWDEEDCPKTCFCEDLVIETNGDIKFCGCEDAPTIGSVFTGIKDEYEKIRMDLDGYCWSLSTKKKIA